MNKLNNKGFTLVEVLAVVVILGIIMVIMAPNVSTLLEKSEKDNYEHLKESVISAAKMYISDHKYEISVDGTCSETSGTLDIIRIAGVNISSDYGIPISLLINEGNLKTDKNDDIFDPRNKEKKLNKAEDKSYIKVLYDCEARGYKYETPELDWISK